jgi:Lon protease-like protein
MKPDGISLAGFDGTARLFPLPSLVLFPHVVQPLHIFEPRYRQLMADALAGDRLITMALLRPGWEEDYPGTPPLYPVVCVGKVLQEQRLPDGRYNLLLHGVSRARIVEEVGTEKLYRVARVELLADGPAPANEEDRRLREALGREVKSWLAPQEIVLDKLGQLLDSPLPLGALCDIFGFALNLDVEVKQELLEELDVARRTERLLGHLGEGKAGPASGPGPRKFPPDFSAN